MLTLTAGAQTLNVKTGQVTYRFAATDTGDMTYSDDGATVTIQGKAFAVADIETINVDATEVTPNLVSVAGNVAQYVTPGVSGATLTNTGTGGTAFWNGNGYSTFSGGSSVTLSNYNSGGGGGGGFPGGGGGRW